MAQARQSFISILSAAFTADLGLQQRCCRESIKALNDSGSTMRVFDEFPCLLAEEDIQELNEGFLRILDYVRLKPQGDALTFVTMNDVLMVEAWERKITKIGIAELLDERGHIKQGIASLLKWPQEQSQAKIGEIICAYVGAINQVVIAQAMNKISQCPDQSKVIFDYINKNYGKWVVDELKRSSRVFDKQALEVAPLLVKRPLFTKFTKFQVVGAGILVASLGFLAVGLGLLVSEMGKDTGRHRENDRSDDRQRHHGYGRR